MRKLIFLLLAPALLLMLIPGCSSRRQLARMEAQLDYLEQSNANIERKLSEQDSLYRAQEKNQREFLASLQASITDFEERLNQLDSKTTDLITLFEQYGNQQPVQPVRLDSAEVSDSGKPVQADVDGGIIFNSAKQSLLAGNVDIAILGFSEYITTFPDTKLTDDAQYWLGECYYMMEPQDLPKAKEEFQKVLDKYPDSDRMAGAMFKLARSLEELQQTDSAIALYRETINKFPQTPEANRSKVQLEGLGEK